MTRTLVLTAAVMAAVVGSVWYFHAPPRTAESYRERAAETAGALRSQIQIARLWIGAVDDDRATEHSAQVGLREVEQDATAFAARFASWDPPPGTEDLRSDLTTLADEVEGILGRVRVAAQRGEWATLDSLEPRLKAVADELDELERRTAS